MKTVIITGGRDYSDRNKVKIELSKLAKGDVIVQGGAKGADSLAKSVGEELGHTVVTVHANWGARGNSAGPVRNIHMLELFKNTLRLVIAFPGGTGTAHMVGIAEKAGIEVKRIWRPDSEYKQFGGR